MTSTALIFAAGQGKRMLPLTANTPKPLLKVAGKELIVWHLERLAQLGIKKVVVNTNYLAQQLHQRLGTGAEWGLDIVFSDESDFIETGGALLWAQDLLGQQPFYIMSADIWVAELPKFPAVCSTATNKEELAFIYLVANPEHNPTGDFYFNPASGELSTQTTSTQAPNSQPTTGFNSYTFSGLGRLNPKIYSPEFLHAALGYVPAKGSAFKLAPLLRAAIKTGKVNAQILSCAWQDVGTPQRLNELNAQLENSI